MQLRWLKLHQKQAMVFGAADIYSEGGDASLEPGNVKESLNFGYDIKMVEGGRGVLIATPEKAILDLFYLNPFNETEQDMEELRLDEDFMQNELDMDRLSDFLDRFGSLALKKRIFRLKTVYAL